MGVGKHPITLFGGGTVGYGHARNIGQDGYAWAFGFDCRKGRAVPVAGPSNIGSALNYTRGLPVIFEWPTGGVGGSYPVIIAAGGHSALRARWALEDGALSPAVDANAGYTGGALYRDGDTEKAYLCNGSDEDVLQVRDSSGNWTATGDVKADLLAAIGSDFWRVIDKYKLNKLTINSDPEDADNWASVSTPAGHPAYPIHAVLEMGGAPMLISGLGVFKYNPNPEAAVFDNMTPFVPAHPDNGKGAFTDGRGRIFYPTVTGRILVVTFGAVSQQAPLRHTWIDRDTPWGTIGQMVADEENIYAAIQPGSIRTQQLGLIVKSDDGGAFTTHTGEVTDQKYSTTADVSALTFGGGDYIYIGADEPFWGAFFEMETDNTGTTTVFTAEYSAGGGSWTSVTVKDSTLGFSNDGCIAIIPGSDIVASETWKTDTVDSQAGKYWIRLTPSGTMTSTEIREVYVCPYRPPIDPALFPETGQMLAGVLPKIIVGRWRGQEVEWHELLTLEAAEVMALLIGQTPSADSTGRTTLYAFCNDDLYYLPVGPDADPIRAAWPKTNGQTHVLQCSDHDFFLPGNIKRVTGKLVVRGQFLQADDGFYFYYRWDNEKDWRKEGPFDSGFPVVLNGLDGEGLVLHTVFALNDASRDAAAPYVEYVGIAEGEWDDLGAAERGAEEDISSPQEM